MLVTPASLGKLQTVGMRAHSSAGSAGKGTQRGPEPGRDAGQWQNCEGNESKKRRASAVYSLQEKLTRFGKAGTAFGEPSQNGCTFGSWGAAGQQPHWVWWVRPRGWQNANGN